MWKLIRQGGSYEINNSKLIVDGKAYALPQNWADRSLKYEKAKKIF